MVFKGEGRPSRRSIKSFGLDSRVPFSADSKAKAVVKTAEKGSKIIMSHSKIRGGNWRQNKKNQIDQYIIHDISFLKKRGVKVTGQVRARKLRADLANFGHLDKE